jgi:hypothetical protein
MITSSDCPKWQPEQKAQPYADAAASTPRGGTRSYQEGGCGKRGDFEDQIDKFR